MNNWNIIEVMPCPARGKFSEALLDDPNYAAETKEDGDRRTGQFYWTVPDHGMTMYQVPVIHFAGRRVSDVDGKLVEKGANVPHITRGQAGPEWSFDSALMERMVRLTGTMLDGECVLPSTFVRPPEDKYGGLSKYVTKVMGSKPDRAIDLQRSGTVINGQMRWSVFDILFYQGRDLRALPLSERRKWLLEVVNLLGNPFVFPTEHVIEDKRGFLERTLNAGLEGIVLKNLRRPYDEHLSWVKKKVLIMADVVVMGFDPPEQFSKKVDGTVSETKFWKKGWIGAVKFGQYRDGVLWPCGTMSGMDEKFRVELTENQAKYLNRVVEVEANGREPTGAFRHPRWERIRDDKRPEDCVYNPNES